MGLCPSAEEDAQHLSYVWLGPALSGYKSLET